MANDASRLGCVAELAAQKPDEAATRIIAQRKVIQVVARISGGLPDAATAAVFNIVLICPPDACRLCGTPPIAASLRNQAGKMRLQIVTLERRHAARLRGAATLRLDCPGGHTYVQRQIE